jgi:hypothetical protein
MAEQQIIDSLGMKLEYTAEELKTRYDNFHIHLKAELEERKERERKLCKPILVSLISEFNRKVENEFEKCFVILSETNIPQSLKLERVIELVEHIFFKNGFELEQMFDRGKRFIKVSWKEYGTTNAEPKPNQLYNDKDYQRLEILVKKTSLKNTIE